MRSTTEAYTLGLEIATRSGLIGTYKMQQTPESISALENIEELLNSIRVYTEEQERMAADTATEGESAPQALVQIDEWLQKRRAAHGHGQREPRRAQQSDADDRPLGQGARIRIRLRGGTGGEPLPEHDEHGHPGGTRRGTPPSSTWPSRGPSAPRCCRSPNRASGPGAR